MIQMKAAISILDRGFLYGDGVFESFRTYNKKPFLLDAHIKRLFHGLKVIGIRPPFSLQQLKGVVAKTLKANNFPESYIKIIITRGKAKGHGLDIKNSAGKPTVIVWVEEQKPFPKTLYKKGWKAAISSIIRADVPTSKIKSLNYLDNILARAEAGRRGANEAFMLDEKGFLAEGTVSNIFMVKNGVISTPALGGGILNGIIRKLAIKLARKIKIRIQERRIRPKELLRADECFVTLSGAGVVPVTNINGKKLNNGICGPITARLIGLYIAETQKG